MKMLSKIFIVFALMCLSAAAAYSQDCRSCLQQATELEAQKKYCEAIKYYKAYSKCNADADVSTEIAMCERRCKIQVMEGEDIQTDGEIVCDEKRSAPVPNQYSNTRNPKKSVTPSRSSAGARGKFGINGGLVSTLKEGAKMMFGGGISSEYLASPHFGIGVSAGFYGYQIESSGLKATYTFMPAALTGKCYLLTKSVQPYIGVDVGLYTVGATFKYEGESESDSKSYFGLSPVLGFQFKLSKSIAFDINAKDNICFVEGEPNYNYSLNAGLIFKF